MLVKMLFVEEMSYVKIIGFIIHVNVNSHFLVETVIKVNKCSIFLLIIYDYSTRKRIFVVYFRLIVAPLIRFDQTSFANISFSFSILNISLFINTLQSNGTLFQLFSTTQQHRFARDLILQSHLLSKIIGKLINGHFRLTIIDNKPKQQEYELVSEKKLNDGYRHHIQFDLDNYRLIIDGDYNQTLTKISNNKFLFNQIELLGNSSLNGWLQDIRINNYRISFDHNKNELRKNFNITILNMNETKNNPCYPNNPCLNHGICLVTSSQDYL